MAKYITILILIICSLSCESPWDIDTPRKVILPKPVDSVPLSLVSIYVESNGTEEDFIIENAMLEIDTVSKTPIVWGSLSLKTAKTNDYLTKKLCLSTLNLNLNNLTVAGKSVTLSNSATPDSYAEYGICRGINSNYDTTIMSDPKKNKSDITFSQDKEKRELWIYLDGTVYEKRYNFENGNSGNIISISDSLFIITRLRFNY